MPPLKLEDPPEKKKKIDKKNKEIKYKECSNESEDENDPFCWMQPQTTDFDIPLIIELDQQYESEGGEISSEELFLFENAF